MADPVRKIITTFTAFEDSIRRAAKEKGFGHIDLTFADAEADILAQIGDADVAQVGLFTPAILNAGTQLRWVHAFSGGVNNMLFAEWVASPIPMTCIKPVFGTVGAEHALAMMLFFARRLNYLPRSAPMTQWDGGYDEAADPVDLDGASVAIVGLGTMGLALAERARFLGMRVLGLARTPRSKPARIDQLFTRNQRAEMLGQADYVVVAVPMTEATRGMVDRDFLAQMQPSAFLIDCSGRAPIFDYPALADAIEKDRIAGVALQPGGASEELGTPVAEAPFWRNPKVVVSPCRGTSRQTTRKGMDLFFENLRRFEVGEELLGLVDKAAGY
jgi:phosphoglycerate dehydrogenase-like enzyme